MKRGIYLLTAFLLLHAAAVWADTHSAAITGLYFDEDSWLLFSYDTNLKECSVADLFSEYEEYYDRSVITVPLSFSMDMSSVSLGGTAMSGIVTFSVTALGERAFFKAEASRLEFETPSSLKTIKPFALHTMKNLKGTLALPEGVETIEHDGIGGADMPTEKLVLPSSLSELGLSAIVLTAADTIEFLGDVPPLCATAGSGDAVNPWTSAAGATPKDIVVIVPDGKRAAYMAQEGIGDWFTNVREKSDMPTGLAETEQCGGMSGSGVWSLNGMYVGDGTKLPQHGIYIVGGRKILR